MKHLRLFEEMNIHPTEFPKYGSNLSIREKNILTDLFGQAYLDNFIIKVDDHYYYTKRIVIKTHRSRSIFFNRFDNFNELKDYLLNRFETFQ